MSDESSEPIITPSPEDSPKVVEDISVPYENENAQRTDGESAHDQSNATVPDVSASDSQYETALQSQLESSIPSTEVVDKSDKEGTEGDITDVVVEVIDTAIAGVDRDSHPTVDPLSGYHTPPQPTSSDGLSPPLPLAHMFLPPGPPLSLGDVEREGPSVVEIIRGINRDGLEESPKPIREEQYFCQICYETIPYSLSQHYQLSLCNHYYCRDCLRSFLRVGIKEGQVYPKCFLVRNHPNHQDCEKENKIIRREKRVALKKQMKELLKREKKRSVTISKGEGESDRKEGENEVEGSGGVEGEREGEVESEGGGRVVSMVISSIGSDQLLGYQKLLASSSDSESDVDDDRDSDNISDNSSDSSSDSSSDVYTQTERVGKTVRNESKGTTTGKGENSGDSLNEKEKDDVCNQEISSFDIVNLFTGDPDTNNYTNRGSSISGITLTDNLNRRPLPLVPGNSSSHVSRNNSDKEILEKYKRFKFAKENTNARDCPQCQQVSLSGSKESPKITCSTCGTVYCFVHSKAHDFNKYATCEEYEASVAKDNAASEELIRSDSKPCPRCTMPVQKTGKSVRPYVCYVYVHIH